MSYEIAGRMSWLVGWLDHWRGHAYANHTTRGDTTRTQPRWAHWLENVAHNVSSDCASADDELISQSLAARHLRESVEQLPSNERQVLLLHVNNGLTYWEIAARLGMDEEVVLHDLAHAYSQLRLELSADELRR
jgi:DNA-directed RNA polymerase specialized sigma24 family protein